MAQTKAQLVSGTTAQDLTVDNINTTSVNSGALSNRNMIINGNLFGGLFQHGGDVDEDEPNDEGDGTGFLGGGNNPFF